MQLTSNDCRVELSVRHVHLSKKDFVTLFGPDATLNVVRPLSVKNTFKSDKIVRILGTKRNLERVAVLGGFRAQSQVEVSVTDCYNLGVTDVPVRMSGDLHGTPSVTLVGPCGTVHLSEGLIIAMRHLHINHDDLLKYNLTNGQTVDLTFGTTRKVTLHNIIVRESYVDQPTIHLDTDEGNAFRS